MIFKLSQWQLKPKYDINLALGRQMNMIQNLRGSS